MVDLTQFKEGIDAARAARAHMCADPRQAFMDILRAEGMTPPRSIVLGRIDRIDGAEDKRGKKSAWYSYNEIETDNGIIGVGSYGDWKTNINQSWVSTSEHKMNTQDRLKYHAQREAIKAQRDEEERQRHNDAATRAFTIWSEAQAASDGHPYLKSKGVRSATGIKVGNDGNLIIPMAVNNEIVSLQFIKPDGDFIVGGSPIGNKKFLFGGRRKGAWFKIEGENNEIYVTEGYSTGASVFEATKNTVYIAFNAGNIYETASFAKNQHPEARIIIAGDDDFETEANAGRTKAEQAAQGLNIDCVFPVGVVDFNDMHQEQGIQSVISVLKPKGGEAYEAKPKKKYELNRQTGVLGDLFDYYNATSGNKQHGFATQCALGIASTILGRRYKTSLNNWSNLYLLNVGKSATGKEHAKSVSERVFFQSGQSHLVGGDGYTSAGAVFSTLLRKPCHFISVDEFGRYLEAARNGGKGNLHQREANTKLMEAISRTNDVMRPPNYSSMTLKKVDAKAVEDRFVHNPCITALAMTTPSTLYETLDMSAVKDGFINRFIINISDTQRSPRRHVPSLPVPDSIINWIRAVIERNEYLMTATEEASPVVLDFSSEAKKEIQRFDIECIGIMNEMEQYGMAELAGRTCEMSMKVSLIVALSRDPHATIINKNDIEWSINYVRSCLSKTISELKITMSHSEYEANKKEVLADLRKRGAKGITKSDMNKKPPYSKYKSADLKDILEALKEAELAIDELLTPTGRGRPSIKWTALK